MTGRLVDVRVQAAQSTRAVAALVSALWPLTFEYDPRPPAAGPEVEITVGGHDEVRVRGVLEAANVTVLAIRTRTGSAQAAA